MQYDCKSDERARAQRAATCGLFIAVLKRRSELRANNNPSNSLAVILLRLLQIKHGAAMLCAAEVLLQQLKHTKT